MHEEQYFFSVRRRAGRRLVYRVETLVVVVMFARSVHVYRMMQVRLVYPFPV